MARAQFSGWSPGKVIHGPVRWRLRADGRPTRRWYRAAGGGQPMPEASDTPDPTRARLLTVLRSRGSPDTAGWLPLTATQQGIWLGEQIDPGASGYHDTAVLRFTGPLDVDALRDAFGETQATHEALRARVIEVDGEPRQA